MAALGDDGTSTYDEGFKTTKKNDSRSSMSPRYRGGGEVFRMRFDGENWSDATVDIGSLNPASAAAKKLLAGTQQFSAFHR